MAFDLGSKRVGVALSDPSATIAHPLRTVPAEPAPTLPARLAELVREHEADELVIGLPKRMDGSLGPEAVRARELAGQLRASCGLPVALVDERLTSVAAERAMIEAGLRRERRRQASDQVAATLILQAHLERRSR